MPIRSSVPTAYEAVDHLLRRAGFGATADEITSLTRFDLATVVDKVLDVSSNPPATPPPIVYDHAADWWDRYVAMVQFWTERMRTVPRPIAEKMTLFWHGHFCSGLDKVDNHGLLMDQNQLFRERALGSFRDLTQAVSVGPAMLLYLDNAESDAGNPNENFARELMELFTIGIGHYSEDDVRASARAWTGHSLNESKERYEFHPADHDNDAKTFFGRTANWDGPGIIDEIVTGTTQMTCARFIVAKLWGFLAYPYPEPAIVEPLAEAFARSQMNVTALLRAIFLRPEFYGQRARGALVRSPAEYVVAAMRATGLPSSEAHPEWFLAGMGQELFNPPNVAGWHGNGSWLSTSGMWRRQEFARHLCWPADKLGVLSGASKLSPAASVQRALDTFGIPAPSANTRSALTAAVIGERRTDGWAEGVNLISLCLLTPEFNVA